MELGTVNGEVELLIGSEVAHLHPQYQETVGRMVVRKSIFGTGWVLNGAHDDIACAPVDFNGNLQIIRTGCFRSNRVVVSYTQDMQFINTMSENVSKIMERELRLGHEEKIEEEEEVCHR